MNTSLIQYIFNPNTYTEKKGDLRGVYVHKFKLKTIQYLLAYRIVYENLEIFSYQNMHECEPVLANYVGLTHIAFEVLDVDQILDEAIKNGGQLLGKVTTKTVDGVGDLKFVYFRDPEGNIVEIQSWKK